VFAGPHPQRRIRACSWLWSNAYPDLFVSFGSASTDQFTHGNDRTEDERYLTRTDREAAVVDGTVPTAFNPSNSVIIKLPMFPVPITAKERGTISSSVSGRGSSRDVERRTSSRSCCGRCNI